LTPQNASVPVGATQQFTATGTFSDASTGNITASATWTSSATTVATISAAGVVTLFDEGPTTIEAAVGTVNGTASLKGTPSRFRFTGSLVNARDTFTATVLQSGKVLIVGGTGSGASLIATCELYDPTTGIFSKTGNLIVPRFNHTATLLNNGMVLIAGGEVSAGDGTFTGSASAELYDPNAGTFSPTGNLNQARKSHTATLLGNGLVLIAGGNGLNGDPAAAELYNPSTNTFSSTGNLNTPRDAHSATLLNDGTVLIAGGEPSPGGSALSSAELYNPSAGSFTTTGSLNTASANHTATLLNSGKVVIAGGSPTAFIGALARAEMYDPTTKLFTPAGSLGTARSSFTATLLSGGQVLFVGGLDNNSHILGSGELYDPSVGAFSLAGNLNNGRGFHTAAPLNNGLVLIAGGLGARSLDLARAETYQSATSEPAPLSLQITPAVVNLAVGHTQKFTAVDNHGIPRLDVNWTVDNTSLATVAPDEDNAAVLTALAAGQVTLTANAEGVTAQEVVTILAPSSFVPGTVVWSSPPPAGFSVQQLVQAVPSNNGPDLYSISTSSDGTQSMIQALQADGEQLWQTQMPALFGNAVPDGFGGLIVSTCTPGNPMTVMDLDATGQPLWQQQAAGVNNGTGFTFLCFPVPVAVAGDGTVNFTEPTNAGFPSITTVSPNGFASSGSFPPSMVTNNGRTIQVNCCVGPPMVNTDGTVYLEYEVRNSNNNVITSDTLNLHNETTGATIVLSSTTQDEALLPGPIIPDGQGGILATWTISPSHSVLQFPYQAAGVTNGVVGTPYNLPFSPQSVTPFQSPTLVLGENGTAFASGSTTATIGGVPTSVDQIASFNLSSGATNWTYQAVPGSALTIVAAGSDGGIAISDSQSGIAHLDPSGNARPVSANLAGTVHHSWAGQWFLQNSRSSSALALLIDVDPANVWPSPGGNPSANGAPGELCGCLVQTPDTSSSANVTGAEATMSSETQGSAPPEASVPAGCDICTLSPPPATSCLTYTGTGALSIILVGDPGQDIHNAGNLFNLAAQQKANDLRALGAKVTACRVASIQDVISALMNNGLITGSIDYFGHSGQYVVYTNGVVTTRTTRVYVGELSGANTNITVGNVASLAQVQPILGNNTSITINGCQAGLTDYDTDYNGRLISIAQLISTNLNKGVYAYAVGVYFSHLDAAHDPFYNGEDPTHPGKSRKVSENLPMYLISAGTPGDKPHLLPFCPSGICAPH
jgi:hypothetical protein